MHSKLSSLQFVQRSPLIRMSQRTFLVLHDWQALAARRFITRSPSPAADSLRFADKLCVEVSNSPISGLFIALNYQDMDATKFGLIQYPNIQVEGGDGH